MARIWSLLPCLLSLAVAELINPRCQAERWQAARPAWSPLVLKSMNDGDELVHSTLTYHRAYRAELARGRVRKWSDLIDGQDVVANSSYRTSHLGDTAFATIIDGQNVVAIAALGLLISASCCTPRCACIIEAAAVALLVLCFSDAGVPLRPSFTL